MEISTPKKENEIFKFIYKLNFAKNLIPIKVEKKIHMKLMEGFVVLKIFFQKISSIINQNIYIIITHFTTSLFLILHISNTNII